MNICVYGSASNNIDSVYREAGEALGRAMARRHHTLIFGGGNGGLMGATARGVTAGGGRIVGIAPRFFNVDGMLYPHSQELLRTDTMRERKQLMEDRSDAFIVTPGGAGTFDEFFDIFTLRQLGRHQKPMAFLDTQHYFAPLFALLEQAVEKQFMPAVNLTLFGRFEEPEALLTYLETAQPDAPDVNALRGL